ncbi:MAG TPA: hypothetical protein VNX66_04050 [Candidatus Sulfotelmatobacter sp.]|jgi:hypothetical protein|nr:hypothetical protein [Candidatus Sulfotelmatobacter sp.]
MSNQEVHIHIDNFEILGPVIAAQLTAALYSNAVLQQLRGEKPEEIMNEKAIESVMTTWSGMWTALGIVQDGVKKMKEKP